MNASPSIEGNQDSGKDKPSDGESWLDLGVDALFSFISMILLIIWGISTLFSVNHQPGDWIFCLTLILTGIFGAVVLFICRDRAWRTGILSTLVLVCFTVIGIFGSHTASSSFFLWVGNLAHIEEGKKFIPTDRARWEVVALVSTAYMACIYYDMISKCHSGFTNKKGFLTLGTVQLLLVTSVICVMAALYSLHDTPWHFLFVFSIAFVFMLCDVVVWKSLYRSKDKELKSISTESRYLLFLLDIPILIGLAAIIIFYWKLGFDGCPAIEPHEDSAKISLFSDSVKREVGCSEAFPFLAGATAFQMIAFNTIYVIYQFGWHRESTKIASQS
jgi:hypothetical protein